MCYKVYFYDTADRKISCFNDNNTLPNCSDALINYYVPVSSQYVIIKSPCYHDTVHRNCGVYCILMKRYSKHSTWGYKKNNMYLAISLLKISFKNYKTDL